MRLLSASSFLHFAVILLALAVCGATAFPFSASSGVTELTPATLPGFLQTHKPVVLLLYAPWCGHCKAFHGEYERFAKAVKGTVRVGAVNADTHSVIGQQYNLRGFPTIKYFPMGSKGKSPQDYQQARTAAALQSFVMRDIRPDRVWRNVTSAEQLLSLVRESPSGRVAALFSAKTQVPPILSVLAHSARLQKVPFVFLSSATAAGVAEAFHVENFPTVAALALPQVDGEDGADAEVKMVPFAGKSIAYEPLAKFFLACLESPSCDVGANGGGGAAETIKADESGAPAAKRSAPVAFPTAPVTLTRRTLQQFCSPDAAKVHGQTPLCVFIAPTGASQMDLRSVKATVANEAITIVDVSPSAAAAEEQAVAPLALLEGQLAELGLPAPDKATSDSSSGYHVVLFRHSKKNKVRFARTAVANERELENLLQTILSGEFPLSTHTVP